MKISAIDNISNNTSVKKAQGIKNEAVKQTTEGYTEKSSAPTDANLYKSMYGVKEQKAEKSYEEQMAEVRAKYEMDVDDKNREIERNRNKKDDDNTEKSFYEQYLEYKHKYE